MRRPLSEQLRFAAAMTRAYDVDHKRDSTDAELMCAAASQIEELEATLVRYKSKLKTAARVALHG